MKRPKLETEKLYEQLLVHYMVFMSKAAAKSILDLYCSIELSRGYSQLAAFILHHVRRMEELDRLYGRATLIKKVRKGTLRFKGPIKHLYYIMLRNPNSEYGGVEQAMTLLDFRFNVIPDSFSNKDIRQEISSKSQIKDPFATYDIETGIEHRTREGEMVLPLFENPSVYPKAILDTIADWKDRPLVFNFPYPNNAAKTMRVSLTKRVGHYEVTPQDIIDSFDLCPNLIHRFYGFFHELTNGKLKPKEAYAGHRASDDIVGDVVCIGNPNNKRRKIFPALWFLSYVTSPLRDRLVEIHRALPCSFALDQEGGKQWIHIQLKNGHRLSSVDISDATGTIPLSIQIAMLRTWFAGVEYADIILDIFYYCSRAKWISPYDVSTFVRLLCGSNMGLPIGFDIMGITVLVICIIKGVPIFDLAGVGDDFAYHSKWDDVVKLTHSLFHIRVNAKKSMYDSTIASFCNVLIRDTGPLSYGKSTFYSENNPSASVRRMSPFILDLSPTLTLEEKRSIVLSTSYEEMGGGTFRKDTYPDITPGGFTPFQLFRMRDEDGRRYVSRAELQALAVLFLIYIASPKLTEGKDYRNTLFWYHKSIKYTDKRTGKTKTKLKKKLFKLGDVLTFPSSYDTMVDGQITRFVRAQGDVPYMEQVTTIIPSERRSMRSLVDYFTYAINDRVKDREVSKSTMLKPDFIPRATVDMLRTITKAKRFDMAYSGYDIVEAVKQEYNIYAPNSPKTTALAVVSHDKFSYLSDVVDYDLDLLIPNERKASISSGSSIIRRLRDTVPFGDYYLSLKPHEIKKLSGYLKEFW